MVRSSELEDWPPTYAKAKKIMCNLAKIMCNLAKIMCNLAKCNLAKIMCKLIMCNLATCDLTAYNFLSGHFRQQTDL